jgi:AmpD protein
MMAASSDPSSEPSQAPSQAPFQEPSHDAAGRPSEAWPGGWWPAARAVCSPNHGLRPAGADVRLAIVHSISLPPGVYGGDEIERLFTNTLDWSAHPYFELIRGTEVSAHFVIRRSGEVLQFVSVERRAWHAGRSCWRGRDNCNDWSVGIELEGLEGERFDDRQYPALAHLLRELALRWPIEQVVGHEHVAPGRKQDPGPGFDWLRLQQLLGWDDARLPPRR